MSGWQPSPPPPPPPGAPPPPAPYSPQPVNRPPWAPPAYRPPAPAKLSPVVLLAVFLGALLLLSLGAAVVVFALSPAAKQAPCPAGQVCAPPPPGQPRPGTPGTSPGPTNQPIPSGAPSSGRFEPPNEPPSTSPPLVNGEIWSSTGLGYSFEWDSDLWSLSFEDDQTAVLDNSIGELVVVGSSAGTSVDRLIGQQLSTIDGFTVGRTLDSTDVDAVLGAHIGYVDAQVRVYSATLLDDSGTPSAPVNVTVVAASHGQLSAAVVVIAANPDDDSHGQPNLTIVRQSADLILKTFDWGGG